MGEAAKPAESQSETQSIESQLNESGGRGRVLIELSRRSLINHFVVRDMDAACEFMADDMDWMGPFACQVASSVQEMREILKPEYGTKLALTDERWKAKRHGSVWIVSALYTVLAQMPHQKSTLPFSQHATYVWARVPGGPRIVHLHVSNATDNNAAIPPLPLGMNAIQFLYDHFDMQDSQGAKLDFRDIEGSTHYLHRNEILSVTSEGPRCRIHHAQGEFIVRGSLEALAQKMGGQFIHTHRSCLANVSHVVEAKGLVLFLDDGTTCPIAKKRLATVHSSLDAQTK